MLKKVSADAELFFKNLKKYVDVANEILHKVSAFHCSF
jgi:hypothetical protein